MVSEQYCKHMGDNVYGDTGSMALVKQKYDLKEQGPDYQRGLIGRLS